jgi:hypothetical protein
MFLYSDGGASQWTEDQQLREQFHSFKEVEMRPESKVSISGEEDL